MNKSRREKQLFRNSLTTEKKAGMKMNLYWVTTPDHDEDWFVVAGSAKLAAKFHEDAEGYDPGDARAEALMTIPEGLSAESGWPTKRLITALGGRYLSQDSPRVVELNGRKFCEGMMQSHINEIVDDIFEEQGYGRLNQTVKATRS